jgi:hypothetical protein
MAYGSVGIATDYRFDGPESIPGKGKIFSTPQSPERYWGPYNLPSDVYGGDLPVVKRPGLESGQLPASSAEVMDAGAIPSLPDIP